MQGLLGKRGVDWMKRRTKQRMTAIHVSIPVRLLEDFDQTIGYHHSRSRKISQLMKHHLEQDGMVVDDCTTRQLMAFLAARDDCDEVLSALLLQILTKSL
jgi:metal-responsive CopG/Arc/MetJ family transcriptional regulator